MSKVILDASALLALLNQELGADTVAMALPEACISSVNASEVVAKLAEKGLSEQEIRMIFTILNLVVLPFDDEQGVIAGMLRTRTRSFGLSLGDRACLSAAIQQRLPVLTADQAWAKVELGIEIRIIR